MRYALGMNEFEVVKPFVCLGPAMVVDLNMMIGDLLLRPDIWLETPCRNI
jgi:hypothetical protein